MPYEARNRFLDEPLDVPGERETNELWMEGTHRRHCTHQADRRRNEEREDDGRDIAIVSIFLSQGWILAILFWRLEDIESFFFSSVLCGTW
jgi:hypothetical protein